MTKGKTTLIQKDLPQRNCLKQLHTHNIPTYDMEKTNCTNKGRDSRLSNKPRSDLCGTEMMPKGSRGTGE